VAPQKGATNTGFLAFCASLFVALFLNAALRPHAGVDESPHGLTWLLAMSVVALGASIAVELPALVSSAYDDLIRPGDARRYPGLVTAWLTRELLRLVSRAVWFAVLVVSTFGVIRSTDAWPIPAFVVATAIMYVRALAVPIEPAYRFATQPASDHVLGCVRELALQADVNVGEVRTHRLIPGLRHHLASASGLGRRSLITLSPAIADSEPEILRPVVSHELGHLRRGAWRRVLVHSVFLAVITLGALLAVSAGSDPAIDGSPYAIGSFAFFWIGGLNLLGPAYAWYSRREELTADRFGAELVGDPEAYSTVLVLLEDEGRDRSANANVAFGRSHPPLAQRVEAVRSLLPRSGPATWGGPPG